MDALIRKHRRKGILLDTNLMLGLFIGSIHPRHLENCHVRTRHFSPADFPLLNQFLGRFERIITTPHILTEVSNLADSRLRGSLLTEFRVRLRARIAGMREHSEPAHIVCANDEFLRFGLTDAAISMTASQHHLVLTDDALLADLLGRQGADVINFNHIRLGSWG